MASGTVACIGPLRGQTLYCRPAVLPGSMNGVGSPYLHVGNRKKCHTRTLDVSWERTALDNQHKVRVYIRCTMRTRTD